MFNTIELWGTARLSHLPSFHHRHDQVHLAWWSAPHVNIQTLLRHLPVLQGTGQGNEALKRVNSTISRLSTSHSIHEAVSYFCPNQHYCEACFLSERLQLPIAPVRHLGTWLDQANIVPSSNQLERAIMTESVHASRSQYNMYIQYREQKSRWQ